MPNARNKLSAEQLEALNRKMEDAIGIHLFDGVRAMRSELKDGPGRDALHQSIETGDLSKLDGRIPYSTFNRYVDAAADKVGALAPATRNEVRRGITGGFTGDGVSDPLLRKPIQFDAPLPSKTAALAEGRNAVHADVKRRVTADRFVSGETRARMRSYMKDLFGPQKRSITAAIQDGVTRNISTADVAARIINEIGLTERQGKAVKNAYSNAITAGLSDEQAQAESERVSERMLKYRADTIAVTETRTLSETIKTGEWLSLEGEGQLGSNPTVTWILGALDDKTCSRCIAVSNTSMPLGTFFTLDDGTECLPGFAHPRCRCYSMLTTDDDQNDSPGKDDVDSRTGARDASISDEEADDYDAMASRA
ncbi:MAG: hypothetical protein EOO38_00310 [Cytophagaceae bacterium]|nr:MAG: hypothetical protein EOO38_00310 [Cytophagaceae bacterium]